MICNMDCFNCIYDDCINDEPATLEERENSKTFNRELVGVIDMTRYIRNRPDKEIYVKARNREYEQKRKGSPQRRMSKKRYYESHKEQRILYQKSYYYEHREEILERQRLKRKEKRNATERDNLGKVFVQ